MKTYFLIVLIFLLSGLISHAQNNVGINNANPHASAAFMVDTATTGPQGMLVPRMTQARRNAIAAPATGLMVFQTDNTPGFYYYTGTVWTTINGSSATATLQLIAAKNTVQILSLAPGSTSQVADPVPFQQTLSGTLTGGNTWNGSVFTVGATGAGLYQVIVQITADVVNAAPMIEMNGGGISNQNNYFGLAFGASTSVWGTNGSGNATTYRNFRGSVSALIPMSAGEFFQVRAQNGSTVYGANLSGDNGCKLTVLKIY